MKKKKQQQQQDKKKMAMNKYFPHTSLKPEAVASNCFLFLSRSINAQDKYTATFA